MEYNTSNPQILDNFTGRVDVLKIIFENIFRKKSTAIIGERRIGKTMILNTIEAVINNKKQNFIDKSLISEIKNRWNPKLNKFLAFKFDISIYANEANLCKSMYDEITYNKKLKLPDSIPATLVSFFKNLKNLNPDNNFVFLFDEMDDLENYPDCNIISNNFKYIRNNLNIIFVHTGAFNWSKVISKDNNLTWEELIPVYLNFSSINIKDIKDYLISPLSDYLGCNDKQSEKLKDFIIQFSGCKPILIQGICELLINQNNKEILKILSNPKTIEEELFKIFDSNKPNFFTQYCDWLINDKALNEGQKNLLRLICHIPNITINKIKTYELDLNKNEFKKSLSFLGSDYFNTIHEKNSKYCINGKIIERFGKVMFDVPSKMKNQRISIKILKTFAVLLISIFAILIYLYGHPNKIRKDLNYEKVTVNLSIPKSIEKGEEGTIELFFKNISEEIIDSINVYLISNNIHFYKDSKNNFKLYKINKDQTENMNLSFKIKSPESIMRSTLIIDGQKQEIPPISLRKFQIRKFWEIILTTCSLLILLVIKFESAKALIIKILEKKAEV